MTYNPQYTGEQKNKTQGHKEVKNSLGKSKIGYGFKRNINKGAFPKNVLNFNFDIRQTAPNTKAIGFNRVYD